jgi:small-conductance mechanosensitive channel
MGRTLGARFGIEAPRQRQIARLAEFTLTGVLGIVALPALLLQWGFSTADIRDYVKALLFGFEIGQFRISLARILIGVALFTALLFATRLIQRWLRDNVLVQPRMDAGIANSIDTSVGYAGTIVAALVAVSYAGFDVTNLAIVAGALSVGIGFGLQSIVNNFVSGLILLIERPVKVGDWIVVGSDQGNVRRISVRATEIETFDRASLIIPNSELISGRLFNWTHRNLLGRVVVKVTADGKADPDMVLALLKDTAAKEAQRIGAPPPNVSFDQFSSTALDYSVRIVVPDVNTGGAVSSDLRIALMKAMRAAGVLEPPAVAPVEPAATPVTPTPIIPRAAPPVNGAPAKA